MRTNNHQIPAKYGWFQCRYCEAQVGIFFHKYKYKIFKSTIRLEDEGRDVLILPQWLLVDVWEIANRAPWYGQLKPYKFEWDLHAQRLLILSEFVVSPYLINSLSKRTPTFSYLLKTQNIRNYQKIPLL